MEKVVYEIWRNEVEYNHYHFAEYEQGMTIDQDSKSTFLERFDTLEEAKKEFTKPFYVSDVSNAQGLIGTLYYVTEFILWKYEIEIDEDGEIEYLSGEVVGVSNLKEEG